mgnify:CR=1 FL=1
MDIQEKIIFGIYDHEEVDLLDAKLMTKSYSQWTSQKSQIVSSELR